MNTQSDVNTRLINLVERVRNSGGSGVYIWGGGSGVAIIAAGGTDLYCHNEPPLTSGKSCFIKNFIGGTGGGRIFTGGAAAPLPPFEPPLVRESAIAFH